DFILQYSTDGTNYNNFGSYTVIPNADPNPTWSATGAGSSLFTQTIGSGLTSVTALENQTAVYFRLVDNSTTSAINQTVATAATDRVDNFIVTAVQNPTYWNGATTGGAHTGTSDTWKSGTGDSNFNTKADGSGGQGTFNVANPAVFGGTAGHVTLQ